jgi:hypothetical protein
MTWFASQNQRLPKARISLDEGLNQNEWKVALEWWTGEVSPASTRRQEKRNGNRDFSKCNEPSDRPEMRAPGLFVPRQLGEVLQRRMRGHGKGARHRLPLQSFELQWPHPLITRRGRLRSGF